MFRWLKNKITAKQPDVEVKPKSYNVPTKAEEPKDFKAPSKGNILECELLGIKITPKTSSREAWKLLEKAKRSPPTKGIWDAHLKEQREIEYRELLEEFTEDFGAAFAEKNVADYKHWYETSITERGQHLLVFKKGKNITSDVVEIENVERDETASGKPFVYINFLRPKEYNRKNEDPYLEWEKEFKLKPNQVLEFRTLPKGIDMFDIAEYKRILSGAQELELRHQPKEQNPV